MLPITVLSSVIFPVFPFCSAISRILSNPSVKVDLPEPVLPTTPIFSLLWTLKLIP